MSNTNKNFGFSLIEVLLILSIIAAMSIAAFIIYPRVAHARQAQMQAEAQKNDSRKMRPQFEVNEKEAEGKNQDEAPHRFRTEQGF